MRRYSTFDDCYQLILICQVEGLETIRSFGWTRAAIQDNIRSVDNSQRAEFLLLCLQRWLNLVLDLLGVAVATSVVAIAVAFRGRVSGGQVGIALNIMLVANTTLLKLVENWTTLETSLGAIARLKTLEKLTAVEGGRGWNFNPPEKWPSRGHIAFKNISATATRTLGESQLPSSISQGLGNIQSLTRRSHYFKSFL